MKKQTLGRLAGVILVTCSFSFVLSLGIISCSGVDTNMRNERDSLLQAAREKDSMIQMMTLSFKEIENNLFDVDKRERSLMVHASAPGDIPQVTIDEINESIQQINKLMEDNTEKVQELDRKLKKERFHNDMLNDWISVLSDQILHKNRALVSLSGLLADKNQRITELGDTNLFLRKTLSFRNDQLEQQSKELNTLNNELSAAYVIFGSAKELRQMKIIDHKGKLLPDLNKDLFKQIDLRGKEYIPVDGISKNGIRKLLTAHPTGSYEMVKSDQGKNVNIHILDQQEFWKVSKYLVVETE